MSAGRSPRHFQINIIIFRALKRADISSTKKPNGLVRGYGKKPDGLTLVPWKAGIPPTWDATISDTHAASYLKVSPVRPGQATETAADRKKGQIRRHIYKPLVDFCCHGSHQTRGARVS